jgi:hypothetical protein
MTWTSPSLTVKWGDYFSRDPAEEKQTVEMVAAALTGKSITRRMAMEKLAPIFGIENIEAALTELEEEQQAAADDELERTQNELAAAHALTNGNSSKPPGGPGSGAGGRGNPKPAPGGVGSGAAPAKPKA